MYSWFHSSGLSNDLLGTSLFLSLSLSLSVRVHKQTMGLHEPPNLDLPQHGLREVHVKYCKALHVAACLSKPCIVLFFFAAKHALLSRIAQKNRCVPLCVAKTCAVCPVFAWPKGSWVGAADPRICSKGSWRKCQTGHDLRGTSSTEDQKTGQSAHATSTHRSLPERSARCPVKTPKAWFQTTTWRGASLHAATSPALLQVQRCLLHLPVMSLLCPSCSHTQRLTSAWPLLLVGPCACFSWAKSGLELLHSKRHLLAPNYIFIAPHIEVTYMPVWSKYVEVLRQKYAHWNTFPVT